MPIIIDGGRVPPRWADRIAAHAAESANGSGARLQTIQLGLVNNMPDAALEDTEMQFFELLDAAASDVVIKVKLFSLPELSRSDRAQQHLNNFYFNYDDLWTGHFDALVITGTEPRQPDLTAEPYWQTLADTLDWAAENTVSSVASCLAAHASVLHSDGIERRRMQEKRFGVFEHKKPCEHPLTLELADSVFIPHSRWNELREEDLTSHGYTVLTKSAVAGVDLFVKMQQKSLFVHFQGHPEYFLTSLLKEYRRDIRRYLRQERETYPAMPHGYFDRDSTELMQAFQANALAHPQEETIESFPEAELAKAVRNTWRPSSLRMYRNWLRYVTLNLRGRAALPPQAQIRSDMSPGGDAPAQAKP
jgi:homoserine O-succinyltransferase/O-acetyltransferase